jgi:hypothetical protein
MCVRLTTIVIAILLATTVFTANATAAAPTLQSVGQQDRHPTATFSAPDATYATVQIATSPDRATDGRFLDENFEAIGILTDAEIASGVWKHHSQLDPGIYYMMMSAETTEGLFQTFYSEVLTLTIPKPAQTYRGSSPLAFVGIAVYPKLTVSPSGKYLPYKVCWTRIKGRKCLHPHISGDWNSAASSEVRVGVDSRMKRRTTFVWYVKGKRVASKTIRVR